MSLDLTENLKLSVTLKRLLYRSWRRGMKESDLILGGFIEAHLSCLSLLDCEELGRLLDCSDQDLIGWILGLKAAPKRYKTGILSKIQCFAASSGPCPFTGSAGEPQEYPSSPC